MLLKSQGYDKAYVRVEQLPFLFFPHFMLTVTAIRPNPMNSTQTLEAETSAPPYAVSRSRLSTPQASSSGVTRSEEGVVHSAPPTGPKAASQQHIQ